MNTTYKKSTSKKGVKRVYRQSLQSTLEWRVCCEDRLGAETIRLQLYADFSADREARAESRLV